MTRRRVKVVTPEGRAAALDARRNLKMASSAHAYVRGSTVQFYRWLQRSGKRRVPKGPPVWICGDCHAGNLGPLAAPDGRVHVQIRDLDQTVIGNPNHDLIRLALSLSSAARGSDLPGVTTAHMLEQMMIGYQRALTGPRAQNQIDSDKPESIKIMTTPSPAYPAGSDAKYARGWMVRNNGAGNWWHNGSLPGTTTIMVRTATGLCWAALTNTRTEPSDEINGALDDMVWNMVRQVPAWGA